MTVLVCWFWETNTWLQPWWRLMVTWKNLSCYNNSTDDALTDLFHLYRHTDCCWNPYIQCKPWCIMNWTRYIFCLVVCLFVFLHYQRNLDAWATYFPMFHFKLFCNSFPCLLQVGPVTAREHGGPPDSPNLQPTATTEEQQWDLLRPTNPIFIWVHQKVVHQIWGMLPEQDLLTCCLQLYTQTNCTETRCLHFTPLSSSMYRQPKPDQRVEQT